MDRSRTVIAVCALCIALGAIPASASTVVGTTAQGNAQSANSNQNAVNSTGLGGDTSGALSDTVALGDSMPVINQTSGNRADNSEHLAGQNSALIGQGGGFSQQNAGGINSDQQAENGDSGTAPPLGLTAPVVTQNSTNRIGNSELLAVGADNVIVGTDAQASKIGVNSTQGADNFPGGVPGLLEQDSTNLPTSTIILGSV